MRRGEGGERRADGGERNEEGRGRREEEGGGRRREEGGRRKEKRERREENLRGWMSTCWQLSKMPMGRTGSTRVMKRDGDAEVRESVQG